MSKIRFEVNDNRQITMEVEGSITDIESAACLFIEQCYHHVLKEKEDKECFKECIKDMVANEIVFMTDEEKSKKIPLLLLKLAVDRMQEHFAGGKKEKDESETVNEAEKIFEAIKDKEIKKEYEDVFNKLFDDGKDGGDVN